MSSKRISVRVSTKKVIEALTNALAKLEKDYNEQLAKLAEYEMVVDGIAKKLVRTKSPRSIDFDSGYGKNKSTLRVLFDVEDGLIPERPCVTSAYTYKEKKAEIEQALRILKMTDDETVNASTYSAISQYL